MPPHRTPGRRSRSGLAYALAIDHRPLIAQLRLSLAAVALWTGNPSRCLDLAASGLHYLSSGPNGAQLHLICARAAARLGEQDTTMTEISAAAEARDLDHTDDLLQIGGQFSLSRASHHYLAGSAVAELPLRPFRSHHPARPVHSALQRRSRSR